MQKELLPLGSVVYLEGATSKLMIVGRGPIFESNGQNVYSDYVGVMYPEGINPEDAIFFNHEDIAKTVFEGFKDEEEQRFLEVYSDWESTLEISKIKLQMNCSRYICQQIVMIILKDYDFLWLKYL